MPSATVERAGAPRGQTVVVLAVFLFLLLTYVTLALRSGGALTAGVRLQAEREQARWIAEAGIQKALWCLSGEGGVAACGGASGDAYGGESFAFAGGTAETAVGWAGAERSVRSEGTYRGARRTITTRVRDFSMASFAAALQGGGSGATLRNHARIIGDVYLNGAIECLPDAGVTGSATVAGAAGLIDGCEIGGGAWAHEIRDSVVGGDAWYQAISGSTVAGALHPGSPDPAPVPFPLTDQRIALWRAEAAAGGTIQGNVAIPGGQTVSYGPKRIAGDLNMGNNSTLILTGTLYVDGRVTTGNNSVIRLDPSFAGRSVALVAGGVIDAENNVSFYGSGDPDSLVLVVSDSDSVAEADPAIFIGNNTSNSLFFAKRGLIHVKNNTLVNGMVGERLLLDENSSAVYLPGMTDLEFASQPGVIGHVWLEVTGARAE